MFETKCHADKRTKILDWIFPRDSRSRHKTIQKERVANSGEWFLRNETYQNWLSGKISNILCCQGMRTLSLLTID